MRASERGFTLIEMLVTTGAIALMLVAGGVWLLGMRPGALAQALDDYDAALASARGIAATSGNGATLVFLPRTLGSKTLPGFTLRVYSGRPNATAAVHATTSMPVTSDANVSERTLGKPPFAIFIGASGDVSGQASYPSIAASGKVTFATIAGEPPCPKGGFVLTFTGPQRATATRTFPCLAQVVTPADSPGPSPTPNAPIVTPPSLVYHWPGDAEQSFVATEWGYTHWFATTNGFACGAGAATFPDVLPSPYSAAPTKTEAGASPAPPADTPFSYPNSEGGSTNDAPARFPLDPAAAGSCNAAVADDYGQVAKVAVQVMGWLTATYGGSAYTHLSTTGITLPSKALAAKGASVSLTLSKTYDAEALQPQVALDAACSPYVSWAASSTSTPAAPSKTPAEAAIVLSVVAMPTSKLTCGGVIYDQYAGSKSGEGIALGVTLQPAVATTWPPAVKYPLPGMSVAKCAADQPQAFTGRSFATADNNDADPFGAGYTTDANGCMLNPNGSRIHMTTDASIIVNEPGYTGKFTLEPGSRLACGVTALGWSIDSGPTGRFILEGSTVQQKACPVTLTDSSGMVNSDGSNTVYIEASSPCGSVCYASLEASKSAKVVGCAIGEEGCSGGIDLGDDVNQLQEWYQSADGGLTWTVLGSCGQSLRYTEYQKGNSGWQEMVVDLYGCSEGTAAPQILPAGTATPAPPSWIPNDVTWRYSDNMNYPCVGTGGIASCGTAPPSAPGGWSPSAPPGATGIIVPSVSDPGAVQ